MNLIKIYRWEDGKILEQEIKSDLKWMTGWRTEPDEAMFTQLEIKRYTLENLMHDVKNRIDELIALEDSINNLEVSIPLPIETNPFGLSVRSINGLISKLSLSEK